METFQIIHKAQVARLHTSQWIPNHFHLFQLHLLFIKSFDDSLLSASNCRYLQKEILTQVHDNGLPESNARDKELNV